LDKQKSHFELSGSEDPLPSAPATLLFDAAGTTELRRLHFLFSQWFDNVAAIDLAALNLDQVGPEDATEGAELGGRPSALRISGGVDQHVGRVWDESVAGKTDFTELLTLLYVVAFLYSHTTRAHVSEVAEFAVAVIEHNVVAAQQTVERVQE
jgi:hypothetical protein